MKRWIMIFSCLLMLGVIAGFSQRRITPVNTPTTRTQPINENKKDTVEITDPTKRPNLIQAYDEKGNVVYVDTITGKEYVDSTAIKKLAQRQYPLFDAVTVGINIWDPLMRCFGQDYGVAEVWAELSLYNRFKPIVEFGLGTANHTPDEGNYTYKSGMSPYFRIGMNYNFMYKSKPDYQFFGGLRYGFSSFSYDITDVTLNSAYWDETTKFDIPSQSSTVGYFEIVLGLKVKIYKSLYMGWTFKYHSILHETKNHVYGDPWYIPGFGSRNSSVSGSFSVMYTLPMGRKKALNEMPDMGTSNDIPTRVELEPDAETEEEIGDVIKTEVEIEPESADETEVESETEIAPDSEIESETEIEIESEQLE